MSEAIRNSRIYTVLEIQKLVAPIAARYGLDAMYLFGSYSRGEATSDSDIDLHIEKGQAQSAMALASLYCDLEDALQKELDVLTGSMMTQAFRNKIRPEEVLLYARPA